MRQTKYSVLLVVCIFILAGCEYFSLPTTSSPNPYLSEPPNTWPPSIPEALTKDQVITETNKHRTANRLHPLVENQQLNAAADFKMRDMFNRQYFAHYGPDQSFGVIELLNRFSYKYLAAGENLAIGNFRNAQELLLFWMESPGHRANILRGGFNDIGIATGYSTFEGRQVVIAVQIFGSM